MSSQTYCYPQVIDALVRGLEVHGGELRLRSHVDQIQLTEGGTACGVVLR